MQKLIWVLRCLILLYSAPIRKCIPYIMIIFFLFEFYCFFNLIIPLSIFFIPYSTEIKIEIICRNIYFYGCRKL